MLPVSETERSREARAVDAPEREYLRRRTEREAALGVFTRRDLAVSRSRTAIALAGVAIGWAAFGAHLLSAWWLAAPVVIFVILMAVHERTLRAKQRAERAVDFYDAGLRRLEGRWIGRGVTRDDFAPADHPYAGDLDLFGRGSLFDLVCAARTSSGQECLARWLLKGADSDTILGRQGAVAELRDMLDFREALSLLAEGSAVEAGGLETWGEAPLQLEAAWLRPAALTLAAFGAAAALAWWPFGQGPIPLFIVGAIGQIFLFALRIPLSRALHGVEKSAAELQALSGLLGLLERESFHSPMLVRLREELDSGGRLSSAEIKHLTALIEWLNLQNSIYFMPIARVLLWSVQFAISIDRWRRTNGHRLRQWRRAAGEFEALASLASYAFEHPDDPFPDVDGSGAVFHAEGIGHPLLQADVAVRNDVSLDSDKQLYIVSGSNMSGKSTLLRTVGMNTVLALAGGSVRARSMRLSPLQIGGSLRTQDSLQGGVSRFYAEILRLRQIVELSDHQPPLLFLLDEILHGTNSHDRLIGAEAIARSLVRQGAIGFITTHDLALAKIVTDADLHAVNVHFEDQLVDGKMSFDYHLRPGVVAKSNALELMRAVGLDV